MDNINREEFSKKKEVRSLIQNKDTYSTDLQKIIHNNDILIPYNFQRSVYEIMKPETRNRKLVVMFQAGSGKTTTALLTAIEYNKIFTTISKKNYDSKVYKKSHSGIVYIIGFTENEFRSTLLSKPEFGFITKEELDRYNIVKEGARKGIEVDKKEKAVMKSRFVERISNYLSSGIFRFLGYKKLVNMVFNGIKAKELAGLTEEQVNDYIQQGKITLNETFLSQINNECIFIFDEIHNTYNRSDNNNWGFMILYIIKKFPLARYIFLTATPMISSPTEIISLFRMMYPEKQLEYNQFFKDDKLIKGADEKICNLSRNCFAYLIDNNPELYPSYSLEGTLVAENIKTVKLPITKEQQKEYDNIIDKSLGVKYLLDLYLPIKADSSDRKSIEYAIDNASQEWKDKTGLRIKDGKFSGPFFEKENIKKYSTKYEYILNQLDKKSGKMFIYHPFIHISGVNTIASLLEENGFVEYGTMPNTNTKCVICHKLNKNHKTEKHDFKPSTFIMCNHNTGKGIVEKLIALFNQQKNLHGENIRVIIGTNVLREGVNLMAVRNVIITKRISGIGMLIQIIYRSIRNLSHKLLPKDEQHVNIHILTTSLLNGGKSYEETKMINDINIYKEIKHIENILHENAIDAVVNAKKIEESFKNKFVFGSTPYKVFKSTGPEDFSTFNLYGWKVEYEIVRSVIKFIFQTITVAATFETIVEQIHEFNINMGYNLRTVSNEMVAFVLHNMVILEHNDIYHYINDNSLSQLENAFSTYADNRIIINNNVYYIIQKSNYYMLSEIKVGKNFTYRVYEDSVMRLSHIDKPLLIKITESKAEKFKVENEIKHIISHIGANKHSLNKYNYIMEKYTMDQHRLIIEYLIKNNISNINKRNNDYMNIVFYYSLIGVVFLVSSPNIPENLISNYENLLCEEKKNINIPKINKYHANWTSKLTEDLFNKLTHEITHYKNKVPEHLLPIGHFIDDFPKIYIKNKGWLSSNEFSKVNKKVIENNIIIGYDFKPSSSISTTFKLRQSIINQSMSDDKREQLKGQSAISYNKVELERYSQLIGIEHDENRPKQKTIDLIRERLIFLELEERKREIGKKKYFYFFWEKQPI